MNPKLIKSMARSLERLLHDVHRNILIFGSLEIDEEQRDFLHRVLPRMEQSADQLTDRLNQHESGASKHLSWLKEPSDSQVKWKRWTQTHPFDVGGVKNRRCVVACQMTSLLSARVLMRLDAFFIDNGADGRIAAAASSSPSSQDNHTEDAIHHIRPTHDDVIRFCWLIGKMSRLWRTLALFLRCERIEHGGADFERNRNTHLQRLEHRMWTSLIHILGGLQYYCQKMDLFQACQKLAHTYEIPSKCRGVMLSGRKRKRSSSTPS